MKVEEYRDSRGQLFATSWPVAKDYVIERGVVFPVVDGRKWKRSYTLLDPTYMPMARPELPGEFAKVAGGGEEEVIRFVRRYGLLGYSTALTELEAAALALVKDSKAAAFPMIDKSYDPQLEGDPVAWILAHADTVKLAGELAEALPRPGAVRALLDRRAVQSAVPGVAVDINYRRAQRGRTRPLSAGVTVLEPAANIVSTTGDPWSAAARSIITTILNDNLGGVDRHIREEEDPPRLVSLFLPRNLLDCIYWSLANVVTGKQLRQCPECGHFFVATTDRMKYCPPPMGLEGPSRCMHRAKVRRWRKGQREGTPSRKRRRSQRRPR